MKRTTIIGVIAGCTLATILLSGCEPTEGSAAGGGCDPHGVAAFQPAHCQTGDERRVKTTPPSASGGEAGCDSHGWGPLSGCGGRKQGNGSGNNNHYTSSGAPLPRSYYWRARHEAGHKNCAEDLGMHVTEVWLHPDGEGRTYISGFRIKDPQKRLVVLYCGSIAAGTDEGTEGETSDGNPNDHDQVKKILDTYQVDSGAAHAEAERIVSKRSAQIDRDAAKLLARGELS